MPPLLFFLTIGTIRKVRRVCVDGVVYPDTSRRARPDSVCGPALNEAESSGMGTRTVELDKSA